MNTEIARLAQKKICDSAEKTTQFPNTPNGRTAQKYMDYVNKSGALKTTHDRAVQGAIVDNYRAIMDSDMGAQLTASSNFGPYVPEIWPVVIAWYPEFPLKDLISVQDMNKPLDYMFFSKLMVGTNKAPMSVGDVVETALGSRTIDGRYPTGEIYGENIPAAQLEYDNTAKTTTGMSAYFPYNLTGNYLEKYMLVVTKTGGATETYVPLSVMGTKIMLALSTTPTVDSGSYMDIQTGEIVYKEAAGASATTVTAFSVNYVWNLDYAKDDNIPTVVEDIEMVPMQAQPRAIAMKWTLFSEYLKKSQFGIDIREDNTKRILSLMYQFQLRYILDTMYKYATGTPGAISIPGSLTMSVEVKSQVVTQALKQLATQIEIASGRMEGNRIVCGKNFKNFLESLPDTLFKKVAQPDGFSSPREIGTYGTFIVYYDQKRGDNEAMMTYRGSEWYDSAYYLGIFMPIVPTDAIALGVTVRESFCSMEAHLFHKKNCVVPFTVEYSA